MNKNFIRLLWYYPLYSNARKEQLEDYFDTLKEDSLRGDHYATYASFVVDLVCFRSDSNITIEKMDEIISGYDYPHEYAERLTRELRELLGKR